MKKAKLTLKTAKKLYAEGGAARDFVLDNFSKEELADWPKSWEELNAVRGVRLSYSSKIQGYVGTDPKNSNRNVVPSIAHAKSMRAFAQLSQLAAAMNREDGWEDWDDFFQDKWTVEHSNRRFAVQCYGVESQRIAFKTKQMAEFSKKHHRELWEDYWMM